MYSIHDMVLLRRWTWTGDFKCREVKTGFYRNRSMQTGSSGTLIGWKSGQTTFVPLWDWMEGAWLRTQLGMGQFINGECVLGISRQQSNLLYILWEFILVTISSRINKQNYTHTQKKETEFISGLTEMFNHGQTKSLLGAWQYFKCYGASQTNLFMYTVLSNSNHRKIK